MKNKQKPVVLIVVIVLVIAVVAAVLGTMLHDGGTTNVGISEEEAYNDVLKMAKNVDYRVVNIQPEKLDVSEFLSTAEELPDIQTAYPLVIEGTGNADVEIFSSGEKAAASGPDSFLTEMAKQFNGKNNKTSGGASMSVSLRSVPSGTALEYIETGKYLPQAYTPSSNLYQAILENKGIDVEVLDESIVENYAGVIVKNNVYDSLFAGQSDVSITDIVDAVGAGTISMGYSNPYTSATGLNFLLTTLSSYDPANLLSNEAVSKFETFQNNIAIVSYTTQQLTNSAEKGIIDAMVCEYQSYTNNASMSRNYKFIPFGVPHSNPLYGVSEMTAEQRETMDAFLSFCEENASLAEKDGFNRTLDYTNNTSYSGMEIEQAQTIYKETKNVSKSIVAEFIVDISGSMNGEPLNQLKAAMKNTIQYISDDSYIGVLAFSSRVYECAPIAPFDLNQKTLYKGAVNALDAGGNTYMYEALVMGMKNVKESCDNLASQGIETKPIIFILTDGEANGDYTLHDCEKLIDGMNIPVYTISYNYSTDTLQTIADLNEGAAISGTSEDIIYKLKQLFNSEM